MPRHKFGFRLVHRFSRPLAEGHFGNLAEDLFGFDSRATMAFDVRFGLMSGTQLVFHRNNSKTMQLMGQRNIVKEGYSDPISLDAVVTVEGRDNFREEYSSGVGVVLSRKLGRRRGTVYIEPIWVANSNPLPDEIAGDNHTFMLGLGARVAVRRNMYLVGEFTPRVGGYDPGDHHASFGFERLIGGHTFQINFSNWFNTTLAEMARGGDDRNDWFIGFNLSRKFF